MADDTMKFLVKQTETRDFPVLREVEAYDHGDRFDFDFDFGTDDYGF